MALQQQRDRAPAFRRQLQPPGGGHADAPRLADHRAQRAMAQPLLHQRQYLGIVRRLGIEDPLGREPRLVEAGREEIAAPHHPQHRAPGARGHPRQEQRRRRVVAHARRGSRHLVQCIKPHPAVRQPRIDAVDAEGQHLAPAPVVTALDRAQCGAQGC